ncbi:ABC transporter substrate-binding protein [Paenibacillus sp. MSJ-34]|uniref:ABC transporter substrate-binding protein n=1 Tax=Paenibacillus sp. MSJ-34 TaxID=2841529 RepID=UPI001C125787|nr:ABC transporter substrate-binding protein [Paenibacillus sp. MSJ-34]MBU5445159.1 ABC transporter substrate-binding protein [Paenibacillus sp. MSJ-34]
MKAKGSLKLLTLLLAMMMVISACGGSGANGSNQPGDTNQEGEAAETGTPKDGGVVNIALNSVPKTLDPISYTSVYESNILRSIVDTLVTYNNDLSEIVPALATEWKISDDMKVYTFTLRDEVYFQPGKFQDGRKMTAEDVKYSLERSAKESSLNRLRGVEKVEVVSDNEVAIHLVEPNAALLAFLTDPGNGVVPKEEVEGWGDQFGVHVVGTGPFKFEEWKQDDYVKLARSDKYWGDKPHLDGAVFKSITDGNMMTNAIRSGDIDIATDVKGQNRVLVEKDNKLTLNSISGVSISYLGMNMADGPTKDIKVREALALATDVDALTKGVYQWGGAKPSYLPLPRASWGYDAELESLAPKYDPEKAKQLLAEAGYSNGFKTEIYVGEARVPEATIFATQMKENLNVDVDIKTVEWGTFSDTVSKGKAPLFIAGWTWYPDPDTFLYQMFHSKQIGSLGNGYGYNNPQVDELLTRAATESIDQETRKGIYRDALELILKDIPRIELSDIEIAWANNKNVKGFAVKPDNSIILTNPYNNVWLDK